MVRCLYTFFNKQLLCFHYKGFDKDVHLNKIGIKTNDACDLFFDTIKVPKRTFKRFQKQRFIITKQYFLNIGSWQKI